MQCTTVGCERLAVAKGLCRKHYRNQWVRQKVVPPCKIDGCEIQVRSLGLCTIHYQQEYKAKRTEVRSCIVLECSGLVKARGYCDKHYARLRVHGDVNIVLHPVHKRKRHINQPSNYKDKMPPEYSSWMNMKSRCSNPNDSRYARYGGRGIKVCERWLESFWNYLEDVGSKPTPLHTIDRINNNGNYEPGNVRWATVREQNANRSNSSIVPGVWPDKNRRRWTAMLKIGKEIKLLKKFPSRDEAIAARREAELKYLINTND